MELAGLLDSGGWDRSVDQEQRGYYGRGLRAPARSDCGGRQAPLDRHLTLLGKKGPMSGSLTTGLVIRQWRRDAILDAAAAPLFFAAGRSTSF